MRPSPLRAPSAASRARGVALIIVLAFVVLLTGLVVAFFSRSLSEREISNSSASQVKVDLLTQGAITTITDDLKQEIAAGSNATYYTDTNGNPLASVYLPANPATAVPALAVKGGTWQTTVTTFPANLVKRSAYGQNFFPANNDNGASNYDNTKHTIAGVTEPSAIGATPSPVTAPPRVPSNRAAGLNGKGFSTTIVSPSGRAVSAARWNKPLLLPKANPPPSTDTTPYFLDPGNPNPQPSPSPTPAPNGTSFVPPDWIFLSRDGSNPGSTVTTATFGANLTPSVNNTSPSNPGYVTGRFAYTIYDEGGLLDANMAGYPTTAANYPSSQTASSTPPIVPTAKPALAYSDLTIPVPPDVGVTGATSTQPLLTAGQVNALVGWRNFASGRPGGSFPNYTPSATTPPPASPGATGTPVYNYQSSFDQAVLANMNGFMALSNTVTLNNHQSDRTFGSRQELINFFTQVLPTTADGTSNPLPNLQNSLQYFGTFSRSLNQPSYAPVPRASSVTNQNPRPLIQPSTKGSQPGGGNNVGDGYTTAAQQDIFSPALLNVRVPKTVTPGNIAAISYVGRSDGTSLIAGEPLVKSRFALQRLSWIYYKGPSVNFSGDLNITMLTDNYGIPANYVKKGTAANIAHYFGLQWDPSINAWRYNVHNGGTATSAGSGTGSIMKLQDIADQNMREPDFFELLKASVDVAALGKTSTNAAQAAGAEPNSSSHILPLNYQFYRDVNVDAAVIQLGANIIDQFDLDGYPTRIVFNDSTGDREIRGVENLPYIYRVRLGSVKVREAIPASTPPANGANTYAPPQLHSKTPTAQTTATAVPLRDTGAGVIMAVPDIWNPHDQNSSLGAPRPGSSLNNGQSPIIRLVANSATPETVYTAPDPPPVATATPPPGYSTFTSGTTTGTSAPYGTMSASAATSFSANAAPGAQANPSASPEPIPNFTRFANPNGTVAVSAQVMSGSNGGFNYPHPIDTVTSSYLTFKVPDQTLYREPTMLAIADPTGPSALTWVVDSNNLDLRNLKSSSGASQYVDQYGLKSVNPLNSFTPNPLQLGSAPPVTQAYCGITLGTYPLRWVGPNWPGAPAGTVWHYTAFSLADHGSPTAAITYSLQYQDPLNTGKWVTYDEKYIDSDLTFVSPYLGQLVQPKGGAYAFMDPRTPRFGSPTENNIPSSSTTNNANYRAPAVAGNYLDTTKVPVLVTERPDINSGFGSNYRNDGDWGSYPSLGMHSLNLVPGGVSGVGSIFFQTGLFAQNDPYYQSDGKRFASDNPGVGAREPNFYTDADGVARRATGAYVSNSVGTIATTGQPLATATSAFASGAGAPGTLVNPNQSQSRPIILNRPFRSVGELGYVFSGNPWKNIDFSTPESAYSELLDVFCTNDNAPPDGLVAGTVDLNTHQPMVVKALLAGAYADEQRSFPTGSIKGTTTLTPLNAQDAETIAKQLTTRTSVAPPPATSTFKSPYASSGPQALQNVGDLVGRWYQPQTITGSFQPPLSPPHNIDGAASYNGFIGDLTAVTSWSGTGTTPKSLTTDNVKIPRVRESAIRSLANVGNTRVWNLMIDVIAQSGRLPSGATALNNFVVEGEQRYWVHLAIDRYTGTILDTKYELVKE